MDNDTKALGGPVWQTLSGTIADGDVTPEMALELLTLYAKNDIVHGCADLTANGVVSSNVRLMKRRKLKGGTVSKFQKRLKRILKEQGHYIADDEELIPASDHPLMTALNNPDEDLDFQELLRLIVIDLICTGLSYLYKDRKGGNQSASYRSIPPYNVFPKRGEDGRVTGYIYRNRTHNVTSDVHLAKEDLVVFRIPSALDRSAGGDSALFSALKKLKLSNKWTEHLQALLDNRARIDYAVPVDPNSTPEEIARVETRINEKAGGSKNGSMIAIPANRMPVPLHYAPTDLAPLAFNEVLKKAMWWALTTPEGLTNNDGNRANLEGSLVQWGRFSLAPKLHIITNVLNKLAQAEDPSLVFVFDNPVPEDRVQELAEDTAEAAKWQQAFMAGAVREDEYRMAVFGLEPRQVDADDVEAIAPADVQDAAASTGQDLTTTQETVLNGAQMTAALQIVQNVVAGLLPRDSGLGMLESFFNLSPEQALTIMGSAGTSTPTTPNPTPTLADVNQQVVEGKMSRAIGINIVAKLLDIPDDEAKKLVVHGPAGEKACGCGSCGPDAGLKAIKPPQLSTGVGLAKAYRKQQQKHRQHYLAQLKKMKSFGGFEVKAGGDLPDEFVYEEDWDAEDQMAYKPYIQLEMKSAANNRQKELMRIGADKDVFSVLPSRIEEAVDKASLKFAKSTNQSTSMKLNDALRTLRDELDGGISEGDSIDQMTKVVNEIFDGLDEDHSRLIAQTEVSRAVHTGQQLAAKASGIVKGFQLLVSDDACDECLELSGKEIGLDEKFGSDDYDDSALPVHPGCRCTMLEMIDFDALEAGDESAGEDD